MHAHGLPSRRSIANRVCQLGEYSKTPEQQCRHLYDALNAVPVSALPTIGDVQRQAHRLALAQGTATKESSCWQWQWPPERARRYLCACRCFCKRKN